MGDRRGRLTEHPLRHNSGYARSAARRFDECPELTPRQDELLSLVDGLGRDPDIHVSFRLGQGDITLINNDAIAHSRTAFEDHDEPDRKRHLLRLWLVVHDGRPLEADFHNGRVLNAAAVDEMYPFWQVGAQAPGRLSAAGVALADPNRIDPSNLISYCVQLV